MHRNFEKLRLWECSYIKSCCLNQGCKSMFIVGEGGNFKEYEVLKYIPLDTLLYFYHVIMLVFRKKTMSIITVFSEGVRNNILFPEIFGEI